MATSGKSLGILNGRSRNKVCGSILTDRLPNKRLKLTGARG